MEQSKPVPMYNPQQLKLNGLKKPATQKKGAGFIPVEDGFITTAGNAERGAKWGNSPSNYPIAPPLATSTMMMYKKTQ